MTGNFLALLFPILLGMGIGIILFQIILTLQSLRSSRRFVIRLKRYDIGNGEFVISLYKLKNRSDLLTYLCEHGYMRHECRTPYANKILRQIQHVQSMAEMIIYLKTIHGLRGGMTPLPREIQDEVDKFVANIERFNNFTKQSKVAYLENFDNMAKELKEANQPILDTLAAYRIGTISSIR